MSPKDKVRLDFWVNGLNFMLVTDREKASAFQTTWLGVTGGKIEIAGKVNDIDGNDIVLIFDSALIQGIQIMEINRT